MSKPVKDLISKEISTRYGKLDSVMVVNLTELNANDNNLLRSEFRKKNIEVDVVRNKLAARALKGTALENIGQVLVGPSALVTGGESIVDVARVVAEWAKKLEKFVICGAVVEGEILDAKSAERLSKMASRAELQGEVVMLANSPGRNLAGAILGPARKIAGCIKTVEEKMEEKEGGSVAAA
jgi:large subunit ribosomal protein L10